jgi:hypothetical protein
VLYCRDVLPLYTKLQRSGHVVSLGWCTAAWEGSAKITTLAALKKYEDRHRPRPRPECFFHYNALRDIIRRLPTEIE